VQTGAGCNVERRNEITIIKWIRANAGTGEFCSRRDVGFHTSLGPEYAQLLQLAPLTNATSPLLSGKTRRVSNRHARWHGRQREISMSVVSNWPTELGMRPWELVCWVGSEVASEADKTAPPRDQKAFPLLTQGNLPIAKSVKQKKKVRVILHHPYGPHRMSASLRKLYIQWGHSQNSRRGAGRDRRCEKYGGDGGRDDGGGDGGKERQKGNLTHLHLQGGGTAVDGARSRRER
jgi:hypothetical protein